MKREFRPDKNFEVAIKLNGGEHIYYELHKYAVQVGNYGVSILEYKTNEIQFIPYINVMYVCWTKLRENNE